MSFRTVAIIIIITLAAVGLSACGGIGEVRTPQPPLTFAPPPTPFVDGSCDVTSDLESWLQMAELYLGEVTGFINNAESKSREALYPDVERMGRIVNIISAAPAPDCAEMAQTVLLSSIAGMTALFQEYVNRESDDLVMIIMASRSATFVALTQLQELKTRLEQQYGIPGG